MRIRTNSSLGDKEFRERFGSRMDLGSEPNIRNNLEPLVIRSSKEIAKRDSSVERPGFDLQLKHRLQPRHSFVLDSKRRSEVPARIVVKKKSKWAELAPAGPTYSDFYNRITKVNRDTGEIKNFKGRSCDGLKLAAGLQDHWLSDEYPTEMYGFATERDSKANVMRSKNYRLMLATRATVFNIIKSNAHSATFTQLGVNGKRNISFDNSIISNKKTKNPNEKSFLGKKKQKGTLNSLKQILKLKTNIGKKHPINAAQHLNAHGLAAYARASTFNPQIIMKKDTMSTGGQQLAPTVNILQVLDDGELPPLQAPVQQKKKSLFRPADKPDSTQELITETDQDPDASESAAQEDLVSVKQWCFEVRMQCAMDQYQLERQRFQRDNQVLAKTLKLGPSKPPSLLSLSSSKKTKKEQQTSESQPVSRTQTPSLEKYPKFYNPVPLLVRRKSRNKNYSISTVCKLQADKSQKTMLNEAYVQLPKTYHERLLKYLHK